VFVCLDVAFVFLLPFGMLLFRPKIWTLDHRCIDGNCALPRRAVIAAERPCGNNENRGNRSSSNIRDNRRHKGRPYPCFDKCQPIEEMASQHRGRYCYHRPAYQLTAAGAIYPWCQDLPNLPTSASAGHEADGDDDCNYKMACG